jgi:lytic murein transglycosylase
MVHGQQQLSERVDPPPHRVDSMMTLVKRLGLLFLLSLLPGPALAAQCGGDFNTFIAAFAREAQEAGVSQRTIQVALAGVHQDQAVLAFDRRQRGTFRKSFEDYVRTRVTQARIKRAQQMLKRHAALFARIEKQFGVPAPIITAIWGLETDFGGDTGKLPTVQVLATMAHDCRRTELFQRELLAALQIIERGDLPVERMRGAYAGELGQTQFLPSSYVKFAIDYDGDGHADLIRSVPDVLASTANYLKGYGWKPGGDWHEGSENFEILREWNRALVYRQTIAYFADQLAGRR